MQSNSLPNHCFYSSINNPVEKETDWKVEFNSDVKVIDADDPQTDLGIEDCSSDTISETVKKRHVLALIIDGLRSDALGIAMTPTLDRLM